MSDTHVILEGQVVEVLCNKFKVKTDSGQEVLSQLSGKMRQNKIQILLGDRVKVKVSPYDLSHGILFYRN